MPSPWPLWRAKPGRRIGTPARAIWVSVGMLFIAVLSGLVISTGSPILMAAVVGPLFGFLMLTQWRLCFWTVVVGFLVINGPIQQFAPSLGKVTWAFSAVSLLLLALAAVQLFAPEDAESPPPSPLAWLVLTLLAYVLVSSAFVTSYPAEVMAGFKRYFQTWGVFFAMAVLPFMVKDLRQTYRAMVWVAVLHVPFSLYQFFVVVPNRGVVSAAAFDAVAGVFEGSATGGGASGVMALFMVVAVVAVIRLWLAERIDLWRMLLGLAVFGAPLALGETKVVVVVLPVTLLVAMRGYFGRARALAIFAVVVLATLALAVRYISLNEVNGADFQKALDNSLAYNFGSVGYDGRGGLNRSTVLSFWASKHGFHDPVGTLLGHGLGASYAGTNAFFPGHLNFTYPFLAIDLTTVSTILWDLGLLGLLLYLSLYVAAWRSLQQGIRAFEGSELADWFRLGEISLVVCVIALPYNNSIISFGSHGTVFALTLGVCAVAGRMASKRGRGMVSLQTAAQRPPSV